MIDLKEEMLKVQVTDSDGEYIQTCRRPNKSKTATIIEKTWHDKRGRLHRLDGPAREAENGSKVEKAWRRHGVLHREDGPSYECHDGSKSWHLYGFYHREDGPAVERSDGHKEWFIHGVRHREDGPAIEYADGTKEWWISCDATITANTAPEFIHRSGDEEVWALSKPNLSMRHRTDGPAVEWFNGDKEWWENGVKIREEDGPTGRRPKLGWMITADERGVYHVDYEQINSNISS